MFYFTKALFTFDVFSRICSYIIGRTSEDWYDQTAGIILVLPWKNRNKSFKVCLSHASGLGNVYSKVVKHDKQYIKIAGASIDVPF